MKQRTVVGLAALAVLALAGGLALARRLHLDVLTPSELTAKRLIPPVPPDYSCALAQRALGGGPKESIRNTGPLSADAVAIYRGILELWTSNPRTLLNVSNRTFPIDRDVSDCSCLIGIDVQSIANSVRSFHILTGDVFGGKNLRLVDADNQAVIIQRNDPGKSIQKGMSVKTAVNEAFASGLFSMSEIAFDKEHRHALVSYSFVCGSLCGSGGTWLFEEVDGVWQKTHRVCGGWVS